MALLPFLGACLAPAAAGEPGGATVYDGSFMFGRPQPQAAVCAFSKPSVSCGIQHGLDMYVFQIPSEHGNHWFWANGTAIGFSNLDVYFYDAIDRLVGARATNAANEQGRIPATASYVIVTSSSGYDIDFEFVVSQYQ